MTDRTPATDDRAEPEITVPALSIPQTILPAQSFADLARTDPTMLAPVLLGPDDKEALAGSGHEFVLLSLEEGSDDSGDFWSHLVDLGSGLATFRLQKHRARDHTALQLQAMLSNGPVGGVTLRVMAEKLGNQFLVLWPADYNGR